MSLDLSLRHSVVKNSEGTRSDQRQKLVTDYLKKSVLQKLEVGSVAVVVEKVELVQE